VRLAIHIKKAEDQGDHSLVVRERRIARSRVANGMLWVRAVATMIDRRDRREIS
jgi:hypothetical protein